MDLSEMLADAKSQGFREGLEEVYNKMDEGVCELCDYNNMYDGGGNNCFRNCTHEFETLKAWLEDYRKKFK